MVFSISHAVALSLLLLSVKYGATQSPSTPCNNETETAMCGANSHCDIQAGTCECDRNNFSPTGTNADCRSSNEPDSRCSQYDAECVFCGALFLGPCLKCTNFLQGTSCVSDCTDFMINVVSNLGLVASVCVDETATSQGLPEWAIIVFAVVGAVILIVAIVLVIAFFVTILNRSSHGGFDVEGSANSESPPGTLRTKRSNSFSYQKQEKDKVEEVQINPTYDETDGDEKTQFMRKLAYLRNHAEVFLKMLNDMRRRLKELSPDSPAAQQYKNVMRDVTRLLYLLNKKPANVEMPADGMKLLDWSEKILNRYLKSQGVTPQQDPNRLSVLGPQDETHF